MDDTDHIDYEAEVQRFHSKQLTNRNTLERTLAGCNLEVSSRLHQHHHNILNLKDKLDKAKQRLEELQQQVSHREEEGSRAKEDAEQLMRELEKATVSVRGKKEEVEKQKEVLADCIEKLKEKEHWTSETRQRNQQGKVSLADSSVDLFMTHLGLDITCTHHNSFVFKFTQVSRANPEAEYLLEVGLEEDTYYLMNSDPPLPCLPQLQDALAASGNLTACLVQVRKLYQRADNKRPLE